MLSAALAGELLSQRCRTGGILALPVEAIDLHTNSHSMLPDPAFWSQQFKKLLVRRGIRLFLATSQRLFSANEEVDFSLVPPRAPREAAWRRALRRRGSHFLGARIPFLSEDVRLLPVRSWGQAARALLH